MSSETRNTLSYLEESIHEASLELVDVDEEGNFDTELLKERLDSLVKKTKDDCVKDTLSGYREISKKALPKIWADTRGFERRTFKRWKPAFDHLEMMWTIAQELGTAHSNEFGTEQPEDTQLIMSAISSIFSKALLVTQEIICLLRGGYPDGALARWRSLHELSITAMYILQEGRDPALGYLMSFHFAARRAAHQLNEYAERAELKPFSADALEGFDTRCAEAEKILGRTIKKDREGEWPEINLKHRNLADMEKHVGMDHWRPRYKWASKHTHADHGPNDSLLGMSEARKPFILIGASNSGFEDPFMMTAISLANITSTFLLVTPNLDRMVHSSVMQELSDDMSSIAIKTRDHSFDTHLTKKRFRDRVLTFFHRAHRSE